MVIYFLSLLRGVWVYTPYWGIIIVGSVLPSKKVLNSQRPRPAKPLGPRALRIPPSIPDLQNYSGVSNSFSSSPSRNSPSTPSFSASFLLAHPSLCLNPSETRRQTFQSPRKYCYALLSLSLFFFFTPVDWPSCLINSTPQNTPANNAPISSHAQQPGVASIKEGKPFFILRLLLPLSSSAIPPGSPPRFFLSFLTKSL